MRLPSGLKQQKIFAPLMLSISARLAVRLKHNSSVPLRESATYNRELSLVAELNGRIVGHVLLTRVPLRKHGAEKHVLALGPMSVVPSQSHRGIGSELINASINLAKDKGYGAIVVLGHPEYYKRFGFVQARDLQISCNLPAPEDALTVMEIVDSNLAGGGHVEYPEPFVALY